MKVPRSPSPDTVACHFSVLSLLRFLGSNSKSVTFLFPSFSFLFWITLSLTFCASFPFLSRPEPCLRLQLLTQLKRPDSPFAISFLPQLACPVCVSKTLIKWGLEKWSAAKSTYHYCIGRRLGSQHLCQGSRTPTILVRRGVSNAFLSLRYLHVHGTHKTHRNTHRETTNLC